MPQDDFAKVRKALHGEGCPMCDVARSALSRIESDNARMKEALQKIEASATVETAEAAAIASAALTGASP